jgi:actin related protein 2/3 complex subunit 5
MAAVNFRKIDVDSLDPENIISQEDLIPPQRVVSIDEISRRSQQVKQTLSKGDYAGALSLALEDPPYGGDDQVKVGCF